MRYLTSLRLAFSISIIFLICACDRYISDTRNEQIETPRSYPQKLAYCTIPEGDARAHLKNDFLWLVQTDVQEASLVAVVRGGDGEPRIDRFVLFKLKLIEDEHGFSSEVVVATYGIKPGSGALDLIIGLVPISIDLESDKGSLGEISGYDYAGPLDCYRYQGQMPY